MLRFLSFLLFPIFFLQCDNPKVTMDNKEDSIKKEVKELKTTESAKTFRLERKQPKEQASSAKKPTMTGYFVYAADAAIFFPCDGNDRFPVLMEGDYLKMEKTYTRFENLDFAEKIYAKVIAEYKMADGMEGGQKKHLVIKEFLGFERGKKCN